MAIPSLPKHSYRSRAAEIFAGIEISQIADNLGVSLATVKRDWEYARTWLMRDIQQGD